MSRVLQFKVPPEWEGRTVKDFARQYLGLSSRSFVKQKHLSNGLLRNGNPCRSIDVLSGEDLLTLNLPEENPVYQPVAGPLDILWEDEDYLVVAKPPGMPVHPSPGHDRDNLLNRVAYYCQEKGQQYAFRPLYRLDRDTSGIVVVGKHRTAVSSAQVKKLYYGIVQGELDCQGTVDAPIALEPGSKIRRCCGKDGQAAVTHWEALASAEGHTLLRFQLETGRTHQIRVHMAYTGHPLAGDDLYGGSRQLLGRQGLHCGWLSLSCKALGTSLELGCPFPRDLVAAFPWIEPFSPKLSPH